MSLGITAQDILDVLADLPPADLLALELFRQFQPAPGQVFAPFSPVPPEELIAATKQLNEYVGACSRIADQLAYLTPIPSTLPIEEFCL